MGINRRVLKPHKTRANVLLAVGLLLAATGVMTARGFDFEFTGGVLVAAGVAFFAWGSAVYAQGKGHNPAFGLLGLLGIIGLFVLVVLPDRYPQGSPTR
ncbi:MAG TPA: hypothetical protein VNC78_09540 [Actinomycetota bacterium]|nr:hypothetical protein [Actinomycetota bacterium]